jgi:Flp pilus assembly pilin Flp
MKTILSRLWKEEAGAIVSAEIVLIMTILVIGMIVGLKSVRDAVVSELADVAQAIANLDQSYSFSSVVGHAAFTGGGQFIDILDFCDGGNATDLSGQNSKCVTVCNTATAEATH